VLLRGPKNSRMACKRWGAAGVPHSNTVCVFRPRFPALSPCSLCSPLPFEPLIFASCEPLIPSALLWRYRVCGSSP
jgi:hypothetical protein